MNLSIHKKVMYYKHTNSGQQDQQEVMRTLEINRCSNDDSI